MAKALRNALIFCSLFTAHPLITTAAVRGSDVTNPGWLDRGSRRLLQQSGTFCMTLYQTNLAGTVVTDGASNSQKSDDACCQSCRANSGCNAWVYCGNTGGCNDGYGKVYQYGLCTLKYQADIATGGPPQLYGAYGTSLDWTSGKLVVEDYSADVQSAPSFESYDRYPGLDLQNALDYHCQGSAVQGNYCKLYGDVETLSMRCINGPDCYAFVYIPKDGAAWFKGGSPITTPVLLQYISKAAANPDSVLYSKKSYT